jgi:ribonuclease HI
VTELERKNWKIDFSWIKAHAGHYGNELADQLAKEAASNNDITECYKKIPKGEVLGEVNEVSVTK